MSRPDELQQPIDRLRWLVDHAEANPAERGEAWTRYLKRVRADAQDLKRHPDTPILIERLRSLGNPWAKSAPSLDRLIDEVAARDAEHRKARLRVVGRGDLPLDPREPSVWARLDKSGPDGKQKAIISLVNVVRVLELDTRWAGRVRYNEFAGVVELDGQELADHHPVATAVWMAENYGLNVSGRLVTEAMLHVSQSNRYHPIRDYLRGLTWDRTPRLGRLLTEAYIGTVSASEQHRTLTCLMGVRWMISAVARVMRPGCQVKSALVLLGTQDVGKSTALHILGGDWYTRSRLDVSNKDGMAQVQGVWIYEIPEVKALFDSRRAEEIKAFLDQPHDRFRRTWGHFAARYDRGVVFAATDNTIEVLNDPTGSSRYLPATVRSVNLDALRSDRDQLWAEATFLFDRGDRWWFDRDESECVREVSADFQEEDPWKPRILAWMVDPERRGKSFTMDEILTGTGLDPRAQDAAASRRAGAILRDLGFENVRENRGPAKIRVWRKPRSGGPAGPHTD